MKTIKVSRQEKALQSLLKRASQENLILRAPDGREFIVAELDDFDREIELQRQNKEFMRISRRTREGKGNDSSRRSAQKARTASRKPTPPQRLISAPDGATGDSHGRKPVVQNDA